jgi:hypothetical protein
MRPSIFLVVQKKMFSNLGFTFQSFLIFFFQVYLEMVRSTFGEREEKSEMQQIDLLLLCEGFSPNGFCSRR